PPPSYYMGGNCIAHDGAELPPSFLNEDEARTFCDSSLRGGGGSTVESTLTVPASSETFSLSVGYAGSTFTTEPMLPSDVTAESLKNSLLCAVFADVPPLNVSCTAELLTTFEPQLVRDSVEPRVTELDDGEFRVTFSRVVNPSSGPLSLTVVSDADDGAPEVTTPVISPNSRNCLMSSGLPAKCESDDECFEKGCFEYFKNGHWYGTGVSNLLWWNSQ
ncbi:hypothetical protein TeGR_g14307, partial [Tetraparma gracilis]